MAALAFMAGAYLVQTRLPKAKCIIIDSNMGVASASLQEFTMWLCAPLASKRCAEVVKHQGCVVLLWSVAFTNSCFRAELRQEDPPNLNILLSGGKETNKDSLSNGE